MNIRMRYFTPTEAEALIPEMTKVIMAAQETKFLIEDKINTWRKNKDRIKEADELMVRGQIDFLAAQLEKKLEEITSLGGVPKDVDQGLVDFAARINGREGYLCWKLGEKKIRHWHGLTEGFPGRKPLPKGETA